MNDTFDAIARRALEIFDGHGRRFGHDRDDWFKAEAELYCSDQIFRALDLPQRSFTR